jgi:hypothetical protein
LIATNEVHLTVSESVRNAIEARGAVLVPAARGEDYAHQQPSLTAQKLRRLEITAGAPVRKGRPSGVWVTHAKMRHAEKQLAAQAQVSYERSVRDWQARKTKKAGASVTTERA